MQNIIDTESLIDGLGLTVHPEKSVVISVQCIEFVGFLIDSVTMTVRLTVRKAENIKQICISFLCTTTSSVRKFAQLIGKLVAAEPGVLYAPLHYKSMELERDLALKRNFGDFDSIMTLSTVSHECLNWWISNIDKAFKPISYCPPYRKIETDSSMTGYGGHDVTNGLVIKGMWLDSEKELHINYLKLKAVFLSLQAFCVDDKNRHIHIFIDNMVALRYLLKMGGRKPSIN